MFTPHSGAKKLILCLSALFCTTLASQDYERQWESSGRRENRVINLAKDTLLTVALSKDLSTRTHKPDDIWKGFLTREIRISGTVLWEAGTSVQGIVNRSTPAGRINNREGILAIQLTEIGGVEIDGGIYAVTGDAKGARSAKIIGGTAALGALIGILSDKNNKTDHALGGAAIGAAVGTAVAAGTAETEIKIPARNPITFEVPNDQWIALGK